MGLKGTIYLGFHCCGQLSQCEESFLINRKEKDAETAKEEAVLG